MQKTRLDVFLTSQHPQYSRSQIKKIIEDGFVLVNGEKRRQSFILHGGENIEMLRRGPEVPKAVAEELPLTILFEDDDLMVINKAPGMVVHPAPGNYTGTLVSAILHHWKKSPNPPPILEETDEQSVEEVRPGIVHRLDKGTSGVMVVAKSDRILTLLMKQFRDRHVEKEYQTIAHGIFKKKEGTIRLAIGRDTVHRRKFSSKSKFPRDAITHYEVMGERDKISWLKIRLETGRTHQIRVHLSENHHPIVGDTLYGAKSFLSSIEDESLKEILEQSSRPLLHARQLIFMHPTRKEKMSFEAPLPEDIQSLVKTMTRVERKWAKK